MFWLSDVLTDTDTAQHMRHYEARARAARADAFRWTFPAAGRALAHVGAAATRGLVSPLRARHKRRNAVWDLHYLDDHRTRSGTRAWKSICSMSSARHAS